MNFLTAFGVAMSIGVMFIASHLPLYDSPQETKPVYQLYSNSLGKVPPIDTQPIDNFFEFKFDPVVDSVENGLNKTLGCIPSPCSSRD